MTTPGGLRKRHADLLRLDLRGLHQGPHFSMSARSRALADWVLSCIGSAAIRSRNARVSSVLVIWFIQPPILSTIGAGVFAGR